MELGLGIFSGEWHPRHGTRSRRDAAGVDRPGRVRRAGRARQRVGQRAPLPRRRLRRIRRPLRRGDGPGDDADHGRPRPRPGAAARPDPHGRGRRLPRRAVWWSLRRRPRTRLPGHRVRGLRRPSPPARRTHRRADRDLPPGVVGRPGRSRRPLLPASRPRRQSRSRTGRAAHRSCSAATTPTPSTEPPPCATATAWTPARTRSPTSRGPARTVGSSTVSSRRSAATATPWPATARPPTTRRSRSTSAGSCTPTAATPRGRRWPTATC